MGPFLHQGLTAGRDGGSGIDCGTVIDRDVAHDLLGMGRIGGVGHLADDLAECLEVAAAGAQPDRGRLGLLGLDIHRGLLWS